MFIIPECLSYNSVYYCTFPNHHLQDMYDETPLLFAASNGCEACVRSLLMKGMNVQIKHNADFHTWSSCLLYKSRKFIL